MAKKILIAVGIVVVVLIIVALALPMFINVNKFKPVLETDLTNALGRKVAIGNINLSVFSGGITVDDVSIGDDPAFSQSPFLSAKQLTVGVALLPLIFSQRLEVSSFTLSDPQVTLLRSPAGKWNFSSLGANAGKSTPTSSSAGAANFSVQKLTISNGTLTVGTAGAPGKTKHYQGVDLEASDLSYTTQFPFELTAKTPGGGSIKLTGKAGPVNPSDASLTPMTATVAVENLDLASTGFIDASSGLGGSIDFNGDVNSDGQTATSKGTVKASNIKLVPAGSPSKVPVNIDYATSYDLKRETGAVTQGNVHIGKALATLAGTYDMTGAATSLQMKLEGKAMPVPDLEGVLPAVGVNLPSGASLQTGTLDTTLAINGPVDKLVITGPVHLANAKLAGFNLLGKLGALASFAGMKSAGGSDTEIQTLSTNVRVDATGTHLQDLNLVVPSIGSITGDGNIGPTGQLDCKMNAKLGNASSATGVMTSAFSQIASGGAKNGIPFKITGTTSSPIFEPDLTGMAKGAVSSPKNAASAASGILGGLLKKKKNQ
ncbi:MAG TPA: AsmA family protein [Candidatus Limnocylindrales bacterium]|nr:AsmA family protein [Candidatus Limnocylindrales bacterium]